MFARTVTLICAFALAMPLAMAQDEEEKGMAKPESTEDRVSYSIGQNIGQSLKRDGLEVNMDYFIDGMKDAMAGNESKLSQQETQQAMMELQQTLQAKQQAAAQENMEAGSTFLAENAKKEGVTVTDSGLQYEVIEEGSGENPKATDTVTVHYRGTLLDGTEFDSSYSRGQPATFPLDGVIKGWTEGVQLMKPGAKYRFYIPSDLAYGQQGNQAIPPNSTLIFDVELVSVEEGGGDTPQVQIEQPN